ncbi:tail fiber assembly protein [Hyphomonas sp.]|uniref:tail fiber assembly protein n=1 Tax=Hyphomonas sp. TaxID=87 RepID=UPI0025C6C348|nr:tail fiber assembly protein [Hyphomonas sp.]|tara:strand:- start:75 stop:572 length:498 start_codon:yes stop_codon:yes gene_type:complete
MAEYRNRSSGEIKTDTELRAENKNMSFPKAWNSSVHDALNVDPVLEAPAPEPSAAYKSVVRNGAVEDGKGNWVYAWKEQEMFTEYTDDNGDVQTVAAQKTAYDMANTAALAATERAKRTALLMETDHYALADVTMPDAMKTYRQALRDVPQQTDFPSKIDWPTKP